MSELTKSSVTKVNNQVNYSSVNVVYKSKGGLYRGFVQPYGITYEAETQKKVVDVLRDMVKVYEDTLKRYDNPEHLKHVPLSYPEDQEKYIAISPQLITELSANHSKILKPHYYAEAKLQA